MKNSRIETLDWLRGLMALSIMFYHLTIWILFPLDSSNPIGRLGIYGVSIFFVLSGLSMAIVYNSFLFSINRTLSFYTRRVFRIWPLFWIVCTLAILPQIIHTGTYSWKFFLLNITTLFGFIKPASYIPTGAWSIGNEMVYYAITPLIFLLYNFKKWIGNVFFLFCLIIGVAFAFIFLNPNLSLSEQWSIYVNPFNNLFLYVMGIAIYYNFKDIEIKPTLNITVLFFSVLLFCLIPFDGNSIVIVSGIGRIVFIIITFLIVLSFYKMRIVLPNLLSKSLETFGIATYGVYLIHPIVYLYLELLFKSLNINFKFLLFILIVLLTIGISVFSYTYFELKFIKLGKRLTSRVPKKAI